MRNFGRSRRERISLMGNYQPESSMGMGACHEAVGNLDTVYFKNTLSDLLLFLRRREERMVSALKDSEKRLGDHLDRAIVDSESVYLQVIRKRDADLIRQIEQALTRIENGNFGICDECGNDIPEERLRVLPDTPYCIACKIEMERRERMERYALN